MRRSQRYPFLAAVTLVGATAATITLNSSRAPDARTYVGEKTCMQSGCHEGKSGDGSIYAGKAEFTQSMHQKIHLRPTPQTVVIDRYFAGDSVVSSAINVGGVDDTLLVHFSKSADATEYHVRMKLARSGDSTSTMKIGYTYGGNGWIQRYLAEISGSYYTLPFQYVLPGYRNRSDSGGAFFFTDLPKWMTGDPNSGKIYFMKWNNNDFRRLSWDRNCAPCHVTGYQMGIDVTSVDTVRIDTMSTAPMTFDTVSVVRLDTAWHAKWAGGSDSAGRDENILIGCESCHGPGSEHVANPGAGNIVMPARFGNTVAGTQLKFDLCGQCHTRIKSTAKTYNYPYDEATQQTYQPGLPLKDFVYDRNLSFGANRWPDSSSYAHHQQGSDYIRSSVYSAHTLEDGCWSCHKVHGSKPGLPYQLDRDWYSLKSGEGCLTAGCHDGYDRTEFRSDIGTTVNAHTKHLPEVSQCVNCHFTKTASIGFVDLPNKPLYEFSAHHFKVIRPLATIVMKDKGAFIGQINTCSESCHRNGRGSRNRAAGSPEAPSFGITDRNIGQWNEPSDIALADSLWRHYQRMYSSVMSAEREGDIANATTLSTVVPNPFRERATIRFTLASAGRVRLEVFDINGSLVRFLASGRHEPGSYVKEWDGRDELGNPLVAGTYMIRLTTQQGTFNRQVQLVR
jgi:hypothetical protein